MLQEELLFPRSEGCPAKAKGLSWTFRPSLVVRTRKWKCLLRHEKFCGRFSMSRPKLKIGSRMIFFWGRGPDLRLSLYLSLWSELQHCKNSLKVSRSSTENSRPEACYFPKSEARGQNWPLRLPSYTTSTKNHQDIDQIDPISLSFHPSSDSVVVRVMDSHAAAPDSNPDFGNVTLSKFPKILFLIEEQLSMLKFIMRCLSVIYYMHLSLPSHGFVTPWMWKSHHQVMESAHSIWHLGISWWTSALTGVPQLKRENL